jgi:hypothetical protein
VTRQKNTLIVYSRASLGLDYVVEHEDWGFEAENARTKMVTWRYLSLNQEANTVDTHTNHQLACPTLVEQTRGQGRP